MFGEAGDIRIGGLRERFAIMRWNMGTIDGVGRGGSWKGGAAGSGDYWIGGGATAVGLR